MARQGYEIPSAALEAMAEVDTAFVPPVDPARFRNLVMAAKVGEWRKIVGADEDEVKAIRGKVYSTAYALKKKVQFVTGEDGIMRWTVTGLFETDEDAPEVEDDEAADPDDEDDDAGDAGEK